MNTQEITPERAYNKGCMWGMGGGGREACPYRDSELAKSWLKGWHVGSKAYTNREHTSHTITL